MPVLESLLHVRKRPRDLAASLARMDELSRTTGKQLWKLETLSLLAECTLSIVSCPTEAKLLYACTRLWGVIEATSCKDPVVLETTGRALLTANDRDYHTEVAEMCSQCESTIRRLGSTPNDPSLLDNRSRAGRSVSVSSKS